MAGNAITELFGRQARFVLALICAAAPVKAQESAPTLEIRGVVVEAGSSRPVADAEVSLLRSAGGAFSSGFGSALQAVARTATDFEGRFRFEVAELGSYGVQTRKEGWIPSGAGPLGQPSAEPVSLTEKQRVRTLQVSMTRPGAVSGLAVDAETGAPAADVTLMAWSIFYQSGRRMLGTPLIGRTKNDGSFTFANVPAGEYAVQLSPRVRGKDRLLTHFSEEDTTRVDRGYPATFWPGGFDLAAAAPVAVSSGAFVNIGRVSVKTVDLFRVRGSVSSGCEPGDRVSIGLQTDFTPAQEILGEVSCGSEFLLTGLERGSYRLIAAAGPARARVPLGISERNITTQVGLARGCDLHIRVVVVEGSTRPNFSRIRFRLAPVAGAYSPSGMLGPPDVNGDLTVSGTEVLDQRLTISGLGGNSGFAVAAIRYNGSLVTDRILPLNAQAMVHAVEVVVDDKPASIGGKIVQNDTPVGRPYVVLARWPVTGNLYTAVDSTSGNEDGYFQFGGLAEGDYRVIAVARQHQRVLEEPHVLERLLAGARRITVGSGALQNLTLELVDPGR